MKPPASSVDPDVQVTVAAADADAAAGHTSATEAIARKRPPKTRLDRVLSRPESGVVIAACLVYAFFAFAAPHFFSDRVSSNILLSSATLGIIAVGVAMLMIAGQFDLSVGSVYGLSAAVVIMGVNVGLPGWLMLPLIMVFGLGVGAINGFLVTRLEIHSLIITLGGLMFYRGVLLALTEGFPIRLRNPDPFLGMWDFSWHGFRDRSSGSWRSSCCLPLS
jgi:simple sugar transport system permease protein